MLTIGCNSDHFNLNLVSAVGQIRLAQNCLVVALSYSRVLPVDGGYENHKIAIKLSSDTQSSQTLALKVIGSNDAGFRFREVLLVVR